MEGWKGGRGFKREAKMDWGKKSGNAETGGKKRRGEGRKKMGPVVVEMSATGAAEMESHA